MKILAVIPAKGDSKRLPGKNSLEFKGKPMIFWAINACKGSLYDIDVWVNTNCNKIADISRDFGVMVKMRDIENNDPETFKQEIIRETVSYVDSLKLREKYDIVISLQPNSPQIRSDHLDGAINHLIDNNLSEVFSIGKDMIQNAAFRIMKHDYVFQRDLSTYCGVFLCDIKDIHTMEDLDSIL